MSKSNVHLTLERLVDRLRKLDIPHAIVGAMALNAYGYERTTTDVDLSVAKTVDDATPNEQDQIVYTITVTNNDATDGATGISITDALPAGVTYVSDTPSQGSFASGTGVWTLGSVANASSDTLAITATSFSSQAGQPLRSPCSF